MIEMINKLKEIRNSQGYIFRTFIDAWVVMSLMFGVILFTFSEDILSGIVFAIVGGPIAGFWMACNLIIIIIPLYLLKLVGDRK